MVLESLGIDTEVMDIAAPGMDEARDFMRGGAKKKENQRNVLPPQIFNGDTYCGVRIRDISQGFLQRQLCKRQLFLQKFNC